MNTGARDCGYWREVIRAWVGDGAAGDQSAQLESHLATCGDCRRYAQELRAVAASLQWLADRPVAPSPGFRVRWTRAVEEATRPAGLVETAAGLVAWGRQWLLRNLRPALGVASLWILVLLFRLSAPEVAPTPQTTTARSPVEIARALGAGQHLAAWHLWHLNPLPSAPRPAQSSHPRSERSPAQPAAQSDHQPDALATATVELPNLLAQGYSPTLLPV